MSDASPGEPTGEPATDGPATGEPATGEPVATTGVKRPVIAKNLADQQILLPEGHERGEEMTLGQRAMYRLTWLLSVAIARTYFRATIRGRENVPASGPFILSPVHRSNLDSPLAALSTRRRLRFMGKESLWKRKASAWYFTAAGGFPVERLTADRSALNACLQVLDRGEPLVLFPEGTRQSGPVVTEMFDGSAWLACRAQCPIVPVGLGGTEKAMGKGMKVPYPAKMSVIVGAPIHPPEPGERGRVSRRAVKEMTVELQTTLQALFDEAQELSGTPNPS